MWSHSNVTEDLEICVYHPEVFSKLNKIGLISKTHLYY